MSVAVETFGFFMAALGLLMLGVTLSNSYWRVSSVYGSVITTTTIFENLWFSCATDSMGVYNCREFPSLLALSGMGWGELRGRGWREAGGGTDPRGRSGLGRQTVKGGLDQAGGAGSAGGSTLSGTVVETSSHVSPCPNATLLVVTRARTRVRLLGSVYQLCAPGR